VGRSGWPLALTAIVGAAVISLSLLGTYLIAGAGEGARRRRAAERIRVDAGSVTFSSRASRLRARWEEVRAAFVDANTRGIGSRFVVVTERGTFDFAPAIRDAALLREIIARRATRVDQPWRVIRDLETLGGDRARWSGGCPGVGQRVFHYRTRTNRALLWLLTCLAGCPFLVFGLYRAGLASTEEPRLLLILGVPLLILTSWTIWRYFAASIRVDHCGITQYTALGRRRLTWSEIEGFAAVGEDTFTFAQVSGGRRRLRFWLGLAEPDALKSEIARRAVNARARGW
jgi:hypothetical protein